MKCRNYDVKFVVYFIRIISVGLIFTSYLCDQYRCHYDFLILNAMGNLISYNSTHIVTTSIHGLN